MTAAVMMAVTLANGTNNLTVPATQKCFLCEVPRGPWAMLYEFAEPVCRACCNYEGVDKIGEVIEKAKHLRRSFEIQQPQRVHQHQQHSPPAATQNHVRSPHEQQQVVGYMPSVTRTVMPHTVMPHTVSTAGIRHNTHSQPPTYMIGSRDIAGKVQVVSPVPTCKPVPGFANIPAPAFAAQMQRVSISSNGVPVPTSFALHNPPKPLHFSADSIPTPDSTTQRFAQIQDTLNTLSKSPPFRVRFSKDHSLVGRVIAFDAVCRGSDYELKVFIEYGVGTGTVFQSASGAGRQMYGEFRERLGIGGGFRGASSNGYKDLEFEQVHGEDDWRVLGELLTEEVRFFRGSIKKDLLPTPYIDPEHPDLPPATLNATRGFLKNNLINRKRRSSSEDTDGSEPRKEKRTEESSEIHNHHSPNSPHKSPRHVNGHSHSPLGSPTDCKSPSRSPHSRGSMSPTSVTALQNSDNSMQCLLCHRTLEDTRFVQCPSKTSHKFCFTCSRDSIKAQSSASADIYCPSGMKCLVSGSSTPWAFMEQEITTILDANV